MWALSGQQLPKINCVGIDINLFVELLHLDDLRGHMCRGPTHRGHVIKVNKRLKLGKSASLGRPYDLFLVAMSLNQAIDHQIRLLSSEDGTTLQFDQSKISKADLTVGG